MDLFVGGMLLAAMAPILGTTIAWWTQYQDSMHIPGRLPRVVLCLSSFSALLYIATILLASSETVNAISVSKISRPNFLVCIGVTFFSGINMRHRMYQAVFVSSGLLTFGWLFLASMH